MIRLPGFVGPSYRLAHRRAAVDRCINLFMEPIEAGSTEGAYLRGIPGLRALATLGHGPVRGVFATRTKGQLFAVSGRGLYAIDSAWNATLVGEINTETGVVDFEDNGKEMVLVDGRYGYHVNLETNEFKMLQPDEFMGGNRIAFCDGYLISNDPGSGRFFISGLYEGDKYDALDYATAEGLPDDLLCVIANQRQLWLFGTASLEVWYNSGDALFPFARIDGSLQEHGCASPWTPQKIGGNIAWLSDQGAVLLSSGFQAGRISTHAVETAIREAGDLSLASAWTYQMDGHWFYCLDLPNATSTWVYDLMTQSWHERCDFACGAFLRYRPASHTFAYQAHVVGDHLDGRIYALDPSVYTHDDAPLVWERMTPRQSTPNAHPVAEFALDAEMGVGLDGNPQGVDPKIALQVSRDGGNTFGPERWQPLGRIGAYGQRAVWRQLGIGRDWVFRLRGSDPVKTALMGAWVR